jgi:ketosteroid isomerase-like protein
MKPVNTFTPLSVIRCIALFIAISFNTLIYAQTDTGNNTSADEQAIRNLVAQQNEGKNVIKFTDDRIFISGAYPMPVIGNGPMSTANKQADQQVKARKNFTAKYRIERLKVAKAGDMAYEFGYADLNFDTPENKHESFEVSYLRVWRKLSDEWKVDVNFSRRNNQR